MNKKIRIAISPCPNDIFNFGALLNERIKTSYDYEIAILPLHELNLISSQREKDIVKASFPTIFSVMDHYTLLPIGLAVTDYEGPLVLCHKNLNFNGGDFKNGELKIAVPGIKTTSDLLVRFFYPEFKRVYCSYKDTLLLLKNGNVDFAVVVNESRSCYEKYDVTLVANLARKWQKKFFCPLALGGLIANKVLNYDMIYRICTDLKESIKYAQKNPDFIFKEMLKHSQEKEKKVLFQHALTFASDDNYDLTKKNINGFSKIYNLYCTEFKVPKKKIEDLFFKNKEYCLNV